MGIKAVLGMGVAALILLHLSNAGATMKRRDLLDVALPKYDGGSSGGSSYGGGGSSYGSSGGGGGGGSYGGGGYSSGGSSGGYGGGSSGGSYGSGGYGGSSGGGGSYGGSSGGGGGYGGGGGGGYSSGGGGSYYGMMGGGGGGKDKDKDGEAGILSSLINLSIPAVLAAVLGIPLAILILGGLLALGAFFIGRSNNGASGLASLPVIGGLVDLNLVRSVHEAFAAYQALSTDENCRQRVVCELGYILKSSDKRATVVSVLDAMLPTYMQKHFKPLKEVMTSGGESGKCEKYVCNAAAAALKTGPFKNLFGAANKAGASGGGAKIPEPATDEAAAAAADTVQHHSSNSTDQHSIKETALM